MPKRIQPIDDRLKHPALIRLILAALLLLTVSMVFIPLDVHAKPPWWANNGGNGNGNDDDDDDDDDEDDGTGESDRPLFMRNNGGSWQEVAMFPPNYQEPMNAVYCNSSSDCWAVGGAPNKTAYWNGSDWSKVNSSPYNRPLNDVTCTSSSNCWAVGNKIGTVTRYNGSSWQTYSVPSSYGSSLNGVKCTNANECYAVGDKPNSILKWDGTQWQEINTNYGNALFSIDSVNSSSDKVTTSGWREQNK